MGAASAGESRNSGGNVASVSLVGLKRGQEESKRTSFLTGHILWQDRLEKESKARKRQLGTWYRSIGKTVPPEPDLRKEAAEQYNPRTCGMYQSTPIALRKRSS